MVDKPHFWTEVKVPLNSGVCFIKILHSFQDCHLCNFIILFQTLCSCRAFAMVCSLL